MNILEQIMLALRAYRKIGPTIPADAVCMSPHSYQELEKECAAYAVKNVPPQKDVEATVFGLQIIIDEQASDSYMEIGDARIFKDRLKIRKFLLSGGTHGSKINFGNG